MTLAEPQSRRGGAARWRRSWPAAWLQPVDRLSPRAVPPWAAAAAIILLLWIVVVAVSGLLLARDATELALARAARGGTVTPQMAALAAGIAITCLLAVSVTRRVHPSATLPVAFGTGGGILLGAAFTTGTLVSAAVALAMLIVAWLVGDALLARLPLPVDAPIVRLPLAVALGLGVAGLALLPFAMVGWLTPPLLLVAAATLAVAALIVNAANLRERFVRWRSWRPAPPSWFETIAVGLSTGLVTYALLALFVPEILADATRTHLPIAREIWQTGSVMHPAITASRETVQVHMLYAAAWGFGGVAAVKLLNAAAGIAAALGVAAIGWLVCGRVAATIGASLFVTIPIVGWQLGHAFDDLFPVLYAVAAILCLLLWQRDGARIWLVVAGLLAGFGAATKLTAALMIIALATAIVLVGRGPWRWRERVETALLFALGAALVVAPWLLRTYLLTGSLSPDLERFVHALLARLSGSGGVSGKSVANAVASPTQTAGPMHSLLALLQSPWDLTFHAERFPNASLNVAPFGIALLMLLPLALFAPRTRAVALLALTLVLAYVGWWFSLNQVARHLMPTLAIVAALAGSGIARVLTAPPGDPPLARRSLAVAARLGIVAGLVVAYVFFVPAERTRLPLEVLTGRESAAAYVMREVHLAPLLAETSALLPPDTLVGYTGTAGPGIYTEALLTYLKPDGKPVLGSTSEEVLTSLDRLGIAHFIWDRIILPGEDQGGLSILLSTPFLREHTRILAGGDGGYLFAVHANEGLTWGEPNPRNLLRDPRLRTAGDTAGSWQSLGEIKARPRGVRLAPKSGIASRRMIVSDEQPYLLSVVGHCDEDKDELSLALRWLDARGAEIRVDQESQQPGTEPSEQFLWRRAPQGAAVAAAEIAAGGKSRCEIRRVGLYRLS